MEPRTQPGTEGNPYGQASRSATGNGATVKALCTRHRRRRLVVRIWSILAADLARARRRTALGRRARLRSGVAHTSTQQGWPWPSRPTGLIGFNTRIRPCYRLARHRQRVSATPLPGGGPARDIGPPDTAPKFVHAALSVLAPASTPATAPVPRPRSIEEGNETGRNSGNETRMQLVCLPLPLNWNSGSESTITTMSRTDSAILTATYSDSGTMSANGASQSVNDSPSFSATTMTYTNKTSASLRSFETVRRAPMTGRITLSEIIRTGVSWPGCVGDVIILDIGNSRSSRRHIEGP